LEAIQAFVDAQAQTAIACWQIVTQGAHELHLKFQTKRLKRKVMDNYFWVIKKTLTGRGQKSIVFYGESTFPWGGPGDRGGIPKGSLK